MNQTAQQTLADVDAVVWLTEGTKWLDEDEWILEQLKQVHCPVILAVNKVDKVHPKERLLPHLDFLSTQMAFTEIVPLGARKGYNVTTLEDCLVRQLPAGPFLFDEDDITDKSVRFMLAEMVREQVMRQLGQEVPYAVAVEIERYQQDAEVLHVNALIWVERSSHKAIVIGDQGKRLKAIGAGARPDMEKLCESRVMLNLWVKVKAGWSDDEAMLKNFGYTRE